MSLLVGVGHSQFFYIRIRENFHWFLRLILVILIRLILLCDTGNQVHLHDGFLVLQLAVSDFAAHK